MLFVDKEFKEFKEFRTIPESFDFSIDLGFGEIVDICLELPELLELLELPELLELLELPELLELLVFSNMRNLN